MKIVKKIFFVQVWLFFCFLIISCGPSREELEVIAKDNALDEFVASLREDVLISQLFLVNIEGDCDFHSVEKTTSLYGNRKDGDVLVPGGVLFFSYNVAKTPKDVASYIENIKEFYQKNQILVPYIAIDQEGGDVNRLRKINSKFPDQKWIAQNLSIEQANQLYDFQAKQMNFLGFNMNLAPVIEVENDENSSFLDTRTFTSLEKVLSYGKSQCLNFERNNVTCVLKHFPGNSATDPHIGLPKMIFNRFELDSMIEPFKKLAPYASSILMSHTVAMPSDVTPEEKVMYNVPADLSEYWVTQIVREKLNFEGLVISDDIFMGALADNGFPPEKAVVQAIQAGVDVIMLSEKRFGEIAKVLLEKSHDDEDFAQKITRAVKRIVQFKIKCGLLEYIPVESENKEIKYKIVPLNKQNHFSLEQFNLVKQSGQELLK